MCQAKNVAVFAWKMALMVFRMNSACSGKVPNKMRGVQHEIV